MLTLLLSLLGWLAKGHPQGDIPCSQLAPCCAFGAWVLSLLMCLALSGDLFCVLLWMGLWVSLPC